jgi:hypothetical protein
MKPGLQKERRSENLESLFLPHRYINTIREPGERMRFFGLVCAALLALGFLLPSAWSKGSSLSWSGFWNAFSRDWPVIVYALVPIVLALALLVLSKSFDGRRRAIAFIAIGAIPLILAFISPSLSPGFLGNASSMFSNTTDVLLITPGFYSSEVPREYVYLPGRTFVFAMILYIAAAGFIFARLRHWYVENGLFRILLFAFSVGLLAFFFLPVSVYTKDKNAVGLFIMFNDFDWTIYLPLILVPVFAVVGIVNVWFSYPKENVCWFNVFAGRILWMVLPVLYFVMLLAARENALAAFVSVVKSSCLVYGFIFAFMFGLMDLLNTPAYLEYTEEDVTGETVGKKPVKTPPAEGGESAKEVLAALKADFEAGKITMEEYEKRRAQIIDRT